MGWHKTAVDGRVMWESPDGQRVADPADTPGTSREGPTRTIYRTVKGVSIENVVWLIIIALGIGAAAGGHFQEWLMTKPG